MTHTTVGTMPINDRRMRERRSIADHLFGRTNEAVRTNEGVRTALGVHPTQGLRVSWGGINGGVLVAVGVMLLLAALGLAIGISAVEPRTTDAGSIGRSAAIWTGATLLVALFVGGYAATRLGATTDATTGFFEGALVWVVSLVLMTFLAGSGLSMATRGAFSILGGATEAVSSAVVGGDADLSSGDVNQIIRRLEDPATVRQVVAATGMEESVVRRSLADFAQSARATQDDPARAAAEVRSGVERMYADARAQGLVAQRAEQIQPEASAAAWITFGALALSLMTAILGSMVGRRSLVTDDSRTLERSSVR